MSLYSIFSVITYIIFCRW